ncbi:MAG: pitrilysin family protein [Gemmatimonadaceae bacterium]
MLSRLLVLLTLAAPVAASSQTLPVRDTTLSNGLHVIVVESHAVPLVTVELDVKNGSYTQAPEYEGLAHLYEHMFFKANKTIPSQEKYLQRMRQLGGSWNGTTSEERVNYFMTLGADSVRSGIQFMEDAIRYPLFLQEELVRERPVVIGEFDRAEANPYFHLSRAIDTLLWTKEYYSRKNVIGNREIILSTTPERMRAIQRRFYVPNNTALILAGDITPANGFRLAAEVFGDWPRGEDPFATPIADPPPLSASKAVVVSQPVQAATLVLKWSGPSVTRDPAATYAADVLSAVLSKRTSALSKRLIDSRLAYSATLGYYTLAHTGPISFVLQVDPEKAVDAKRVALDEITRMGDSTYVTQEELEDAQKELGIQALYEREQTSEWAHTIGFWWAAAGLDYYRTYLPNMQRVTRGDLARYVQTYLIGKPYVAGLMMNAEAIKKTGITADALLTGALVP